MPIYTLQCKTCGFVSEELITRIPKNLEEEIDMMLGFVCCETPMTKIPSLSSFHLKGTGWFKDGYASNQKKATD